MKRHFTRRVFVSFIAVVMLAGIIAVPIAPAVAEPLSVGATAADANGLSIAEFSGRLGEWDKVDYDSAVSLRDTLMGIKGYQQDGFLYISVETEANGFGPNPTVYIDNGETPGTTKFEVGAWRHTNNWGMWNNRISHRIVGGKLQRWVSGAGDTAVWADVADSAMVGNERPADGFMEFRIPYSDLGVAAAAKNFMRVGYFNGQAFFRPASGRPMLVIDPPMQLLNKENMPSIKVDGDPSDWLAAGLLPIGSGDRRTSNTTSNMYGGDMYAFRDGNWLYILLFGRDSHTNPPRPFDTRGALDDGELCIVIDTDADPQTGYSPSFTTMYTASGANYQIRANKLQKFLLAPDGTGSYDTWDDFGSLLLNQAAYEADPKAYVYAANEPLQRAYGTLTPEQAAPFIAQIYRPQTGNNVDFFRQFVEIAIDLSVMERFGEEKFAETLKLGMFIDGSAYMPFTSSTGTGNPQGVMPSAYAAVPSGVRHNFTMTGNKADWAKVEAQSYYEPNQYEMNMTTDGELLYTMITGLAMNTQNVYFIDVGESGFSRQGRPGVDYIVANGWLYRPTVTGNVTNP